MKALINSPALVAERLLIMVIFSSPLIIAHITVKSCYEATFAQNVLPEWSTAPWISFLGVYHSNIFQIGFTMIGLSIFIINYFFIQKLVTNEFVFTDVHKSYWQDWILRNALNVYAISAVTLGCINIDHEYVAEFLSVDIQNLSQNIWCLTKWNYQIHMASYFVGGFSFMAFMVVTMTKFNTDYHYYLKYSYVFKWFLLMTTGVFGTSLNFFALFYACLIADVNNERDLFWFHSAINCTGWLQYIGLHSGCLVFVSYGYDYVIVVNHKLNKE